MFATQDFNTPPPPNYVAGLGRGATGFTTRSDIGPMRFEPGGGGERKRGPESDLGDYSESNYDEFEGYKGSLFSSSTTPYDADDAEADRVYNRVDERMDSRRKRRREEKLKADMEKYRASQPKIQQLFAQEKKALATLSEDQWNAIPDIGDRSVKRRQRPERFTPVPDSIIEASHSEAAPIAAIDPRGGLTTPLTPLPGLATPATPLTSLSGARETVLGIKLDQLGDSVTGKTNVDPTGYMTSMKSLRIHSDTQVGDIKKARQLLESVTECNTNHAPGWLARARLEENVGKISQARHIIEKGCAACPLNADLWLENARLQGGQNAKRVLAQAVRHLPHSVKLWMRAAELEEQRSGKSRVYRKALELIPNSVQLWKAAIELEDPQDAKILLSRAVECVPTCTEMWLALARLESYENARRILNKARGELPNEHLIWVAAAQLEEENGNGKRVEMLLGRGLQILATHSVVLAREQWLHEAERMEDVGALATCQAIVNLTIGTGVELADAKSTWTDDADGCLERHHAHTARCIFEYALEHSEYKLRFRVKKSMWLRAAYLEKEHGTHESLERIIQKGLDYCPQAEVLWLMWAKDKWVRGDIDGARRVLRDAGRNVSDSEEIWLAAVKLESENEETARARYLLRDAREQCNKPRVWMKSALLERSDGQHADCQAILREGILKHPNFPKLHLMLAQSLVMSGDADGARAAFNEGVDRCPQCIALWTEFVRFEEAHGSIPRARVLLERARRRNPQNDQLWCCAIRLEHQNDNDKAAALTLARALQECPRSGLLWAEAIGMEVRSKQKARVTDALLKNSDDPRILVAVAKIFWRERKVEKARSWLNRAVRYNPDLGDTWAALYKFELQHGTPEQQEEVLKRCCAAEPRHGEFWQRIAKDPTRAQRPSTEECLRAVVRII